MISPSPLTSLTFSDQLPLPPVRYASRRILIFDLILYFLFILGMTSVILYSTKPVSEAQSPLQPEEQALVSMVLDRFT